MTKEPIKADTEQLDDSDLYELYELIRHTLQTRVRLSENLQLPDLASSDLCGIWQDNRAAEEIIEHILAARTKSRKFVL